jgi:K+/H+ antiporter YhaU regulatory subunit KhtT
METDKLFLILGDIIELISPKNSDLNNEIFLIEYIDDTKMKLRNEKMDLTLLIENKQIVNKDIKMIKIISRAESPSYAIQHDFTINKWISIHLQDGTNIVGEITDLQEDQIEIQIPGEENPIYIDFEYQGIPENLMIESIELTNPPEEEQEEKEILFEAREEEEGIEIEDEDDIFLDKSPLPNLSKQLLDTDFEIQLREIEEVTIFIDSDEKSKRYNIEIQTNDLLENLLNQIPIEKRSLSELNKIHTMIERFIQLRKEYGVFNKYHHVTGFRQIDKDWKPLKENLLHLRKPLYWMVPVGVNIKKIYTDQDDEEIDENVSQMNITILNLMESLNLINEFVDQYNSVSSIENKYDELYSKLNPLFTPFENSAFEHKKEKYLTNQHVHQHMDILLNNNENFKSYAFSSDEIKNTSFLFSTYTKGLDRLKTILSKGSRLITERKKMTENDEITITSFITCPEPVVTFSKINLPTTLLLQRSNLNESFIHYSKIFHKKTPIQKVEINSLKEQIVFDKDNYANNIKNYVLNYDSIELIEQTFSYEKYLDTIIPMTRILFQLIQKYIVGKLCILEILHYLEPFLIYSKDLTYKQFEDIHHFLNDKIKEFYETMTKKEKELNQLRYYKSFTSQSTFYKNAFTEKIYQLVQHSYPLPELHNIQNILFESYQYNKTELFLSNSELLKKLILIDNGLFYNNVVNFNTYMLNYSEDIIPLLEEEKQKIESKKIENKCKNYIIAKQYSSKEELESDESTEIYFDKKLDKTNYDLIKSFQKEKEKLSPEEFLVFLRKKLKGEHNLAETLILGKKKVENDQYAYYVEEGNLFFYKRVSDGWSKVKDQEEILKLNSSEDLCNFQPKCIYVKEQCESMEKNSQQLTLDSFNTIVKEFDEFNEIKKDELLERLLLHFEYYKETISKKIMIIKYNLLKNNYKEYLLGQSIADTIEVKHSPYEKLCNAILGEEDFIKKQSSIYTFCQLYTRIANDLNDQITENNFWLYCIETGVQLIPSFLFQLAFIFVENPEKYNSTMDKIIKEQGIISDDGEKWVDKYSGYTIKNIDFMDDEGFITGIGLLDEEIEIEEEKTIYTKETILIKNIIDTLTFFMGISLKEQMDFLLRMITKQLSNLPNEKQYNESKQAKKTPYQEFIHLNTLFLSVGIILVSIQSAIPSIQSKKTFPGCIKSFIGYPLDIKENKEAVNYISCIVFKIKSKSVVPWNTLTKFKTQESIADTLMIYLEKIILKDSEIVNLLDEKRSYLISNVEDLIPSEYSLNKWVLFLPPLFSFHIPEISTLESSFQQSLIKNIKDGNNEQLNKIHIIKSKNMFYALKIQEYIQSIIQKKVLLLKNNYNEPFIENACCNETSQGSVIDYFIKENKEILVNCQYSQDLTNIINDIVLLTKAELYHSTLDTKMIYPPLSTQYNETTIYLAFIVYCKFNHILAIPNYLKEVCKEKPSYVSGFENTQEMIKKLKEDTFHYTEENLIELMNLVNRKNIVSFVFNKLYDPQTILFYQNVVLLLDEETILDEDESLLKNLVNSIAQITTLKTLEGTAKSSSTMNDINRTIQNDLIKKNKAIKTTILKFLRENNKQKPNKKLFTTIDSFLNHLTEFIGYQRDNEDTFFTYIQFIKNNIQLFVNVFPNIILNHLEPTIEIPKYMNDLSFSHKLKLIDYMSEYFNPFSSYFHNAVIYKVLVEIQQKAKMLIDLVNTCPVIINQKYNVDYSSFDQPIVTLLMEFLFLKVIQCYIQLTDSTSCIVLPKKTGAKKEKTFTTLDEIEDEYVEFSVEANVFEGNKKELQNNISDMLKTFLSIMKKQKDDINISYDSIMDKIFKLKEAEKSLFTSELKAKTEEERNVDTELKRNKLGRWNKGLQKGLTEYDENVWEEEQNMRDILKGIEDRAIKDGEEQNIEDIMGQLLVDEREDRENTDMRMLSENFMDGDDWEGYEMEEEDWEQQN